MIKKIILLNASPRKDKNTAQMLAFVAQTVLMTFCVLVIMSCSTWNSSGYEMLPTLERNKIVECQDGIGNLYNDGQVYLVTTEQLQEYLDTAGRVVIYEYLFYCKSEHCINPLAVEQDCKSQGARLLLMMENYKGIIGLPALDSPVLAANPAPFGKTIAKTCTPQFFNQLTSTTYKTRGYGRYYLFDNGKFKGCFNDYKDALSTDSRLRRESDKTLSMSLPPRTADSRPWRESDKTLSKSLSPQTTDKSIFAGA